MKTISMSVSSECTIDNSKMVYAAINELCQYEVQVGFPKEYSKRHLMASDELRRGGIKLTNPQIAYILEQGDTKLNIPRRPFLVPGVERAIPKLIPLLGPAVREILAKGIPRDSLIKVGRAARNSVRWYILFGNHKPLAAATIRYRKQAGIELKTPLIETGRLRNALSYMVSMNGQRVYLSPQIRETLPASPDNLMRKVGKNLIP